MKFLLYISFCIFFLGCSSLYLIGNEKSKDFLDVVVFDSNKLVKWDKKDLTIIYERFKTPLKGSLESEREDLKEKLIQETVNEINIELKETGIKFNFISVKNKKDIDYDIKLNLSEKFYFVKRRSKTEELEETRQTLEYPFYVKRDVPQLARLTENRFKLTKVEIEEIDVQYEGSLQEYRQTLEQMRDRMFPMYTFEKKKLIKSEVFAAFMPKSFGGMTRFDVREINVMKKVIKKEILRSIGMNIKDKDSIMYTRDILEKQNINLSEKDKEFVKRLYNDKFESGMKKSNFIKKILEK